VRRFGGVVAQYLGDGGATTREFESSHPGHAVGLELLVRGSILLTGKACTIGRLPGHRTTVQPQGVFWPGYFRRMNSSP
jgi:hypothetical protein